MIRNSPQRLPPSRPAQRPPADEAGGPVPSRSGEAFATSFQRERPAGGPRGEPLETPEQHEALRRDAQAYLACVAIFAPPPAKRPDVREVMLQVEALGRRLAVEPAPPRPDLLERAAALARDLRAAPGAFNEDDLRACCWLQYLGDGPQAQALASSVAMRIMDDRCFARDGLSIASACGGLRGLGKGDGARALARVLTCVTRTSSASTQLGADALCTASTGLQGLRQTPEARALAEALFDRRSKGPDRASLAALAYAIAAVLPELAQSRLGTWLIAELEARSDTQELLEEPARRGSLAAMEAAGLWDRIPASFHIRHRQRQRAPRGKAERAPFEAGPWRQDGKHGAAPPADEGPHGPGPAPAAGGGVPVLPRQRDLTALLAQAKSPQSLIDDIEQHLAGGGPAIPASGVGSVIRKIGVLMTSSDPLGAPAPPTGRQVDLLSQWLARAPGTFDKEAFLAVLGNLCHLGQGDAAQRLWQVVAWRLERLTWTPTAPVMAAAYRGLKGLADCAQAHALLRALAHLASTASVRDLSASEISFACCGLRDLPDRYETQALTQALASWIRASRGVRLNALQLGYACTGLRRMGDSEAAEALSSALAGLLRASVELTLDRASLFKACRGLLNLRRCGHALAMALAQRLNTTPSLRLSRPELTRLRASVDGLVDSEASRALVHALESHAFTRKRWGEPAAAGPGERAGTSPGPSRLMPVYTQPDLPSMRRRAPSSAPASWAHPPGPGAFPWPVAGAAPSTATLAPRQGPAFPGPFMPAAAPGWPGQR